MNNNINLLSIYGYVDSNNIQFFFEDIDKESKLKEENYVNFDDNIILNFQINKLNLSWHPSLITLYFNTICLKIDKDKKIKEIKDKLLGHISNLKDNSNKMFDLITDEILKQ